MYVVFCAGVLHGNKVPAIMSTFRTPATYNLDLHDCADGGLDFISPRSDVFLLNSRVSNNLGTGINVLGECHVVIFGELKSNIDANLLHSVF